MRGYNYHMCWKSFSVKKIVRNDYSVFCAFVIGMCYHVISTCKCGNNETGTEFSSPFSSNFFISKALLVHICIYEYFIVRVIFLILR